MKKNHGFTLVEVLVSVVILAILGTVFFQFFVLSQKAASGNKEKIEAVTLAHAVLEDVKSGEYPEITTGCSSDFPMKKTVNKENYSIEIDVGAELEEGLKLHSIEIKVFDSDGKMQTSVRGVVEICADESGTNAS